MSSKRNNPKYPPDHCFTVCKCEKCYEWYEPICCLPHICKKQNSYPSENCIGENLSRLMKERGYTQTQLAEKAHCTQSDISNYVLSKRKPTNERLEMLAEALGVTVYDLV